MPNQRLKSLDDFMQGLNITIEQALPAVTHTIIASTLRSVAEALIECADNVERKAQ